MRRRVAADKLADSTGCAGRPRCAWRLLTAAFAPRRGVRRSRVGYARDGTAHGSRDPNAADRSAGGGAGRRPARCDRWRMALLRGRRVGYEVCAARPDRRRQLRRSGAGVALAHRGFASAGRGRARRLPRCGRDRVRAPGSRESRPLGDATGHRPPVGDAADGGRRAVCGHAAVPGGRDRCPHRRDALGPQPARLRVRQPAAAVSLEPPRRGLLGGRRRGADHLGHRRRLPHRGRCPHRVARRGLRRQRAHQPGGGGPAGARQPEPVAAPVPVRHPWWWATPSSWARRCTTTC